MSDRKEKTVTLGFQGRFDGTVEAFEVNGMMAIPSEEGVTYVHWDDVVKFFPQASESSTHVDDHPLGATDFQPNKSGQSAGTFWKFEENVWSWWYDGKWRERQGSEIEPSGLFKIRQEKFHG